MSHSHRKRKNDTSPVLEYYFFPLWNAVLSYTVCIEMEITKFNPYITLGITGPQEEPQNIQVILLPLIYESQICLSSF